MRVSPWTRKIRWRKSIIPWNGIRKFTLESDLALDGSKDRCSMRFQRCKVSLNHEEAQWKTVKPAKVYEKYSPGVKSAKVRRSRFLCDLRRGSGEFQRRRHSFPTGVPQETTVKWGARFTRISGWPPVRGWSEKILSKRNKRLRVAEGVWESPGSCENRDDIFFREILVRVCNLPFNYMSMLRLEK